MFQAINLLKLGAPGNEFQHGPENQTTIKIDGGLCSPPFFMCGVGCASFKRLGQPRHFIKTGQRKSFGNRRPRLAAL
jgi:hypothetical protein